MVVRKSWIPSVGFGSGEAAPLDPKHGQAYSLETGSDPFYPRGEVRADTTPYKSSDSASAGESLKRSSTQDWVDTQDRIIHLDSLEHGLGDFCAVRGCLQPSHSCPTF
jgi:Na+-exporting ATPase